MRCGMDSGRALHASGLVVRLVPGAGFEPARLSPRNFKSLASTSFATRAGCDRVERDRKQALEAGVGIEPAYTALQAAA